jgi:hypothetical protein
MKRIYLVAACLVAASLACAVQVPGTPVMTTAQPQRTSPVPTASAVSPTATEEGARNIAVVRQVSVNVRDAAGGNPTGEYVYQGQELTVLEVVTLENGDEWVRIADPAGWVFAGCLEGSEKGCVAR